MRLRVYVLVVCVQWLCLSLTALGQPARLPDLPRGVTSLGAATVGDWLYVYGGHFGEAHRYARETQSGELRRLNLTKPTRWEFVTSARKMQGMAFVAYRGTLLRLGGMVAENSKGEPHRLRSIAECKRFDPKRGKWLRFPDLPEPRSSHDAVLLGDKLYVIGGWNIQGDQRTWHQTAWVADLSAKPVVWRPLPKPPFQRRALSLGVMGGRVYVVGGMQARGGPTRRVDILDPASRQWHRGPDLVAAPKDSPRPNLEGFGTAAFGAGSRLFVSTYSGRLQQLDERAKTWRVARSMKQGRFFHRMVGSRERLFLVGGASMAAGKRTEVEVIEMKK